MHYDTKKHIHVANVVHTFRTYFPKYLIDIVNLFFLVISMVKSFELGGRQLCVWTGQCTISVIQLLSAVAEK